MESLHLKKTDINKEALGEWFDTFVSHINTERLMMESDVAPAAMSEFWNSAITSDFDAISKNIRAQTTQYFIKNIVKYYLSELATFTIKPQKLAFDFSDAKILVWAQIADNDESSEKAFILSEARSNDKFHENGFFVSTTIVEESDMLNLPPHYHEVNIHGRFSGAH